MLLDRYLLLSFFVPYFVNSFNWNNGLKRESLFFLASNPAVAQETLRPLGSYELLLSRSIPSSINVSISHGVTALLSGKVLEEQLKTAILRILQRHVSIQDFVFSRCDFSIDISTRQAPYAESSY